MVEGGSEGLFLTCRQRQHLGEEIIPGLRNPPFASANSIGEERLPGRLVISDRLVAAQLLRDFGCTRRAIDGDNIGHHRFERRERQHGSRADRGEHDGDDGDDPRDTARANRCHEPVAVPAFRRSEEHTSELQSLMRISYAVFFLKKKKKKAETRQHISVKYYLLYTKP